MDSLQCNALIYNFAGNRGVVLKRDIIYAQNTKIKYMETKKSTKKTSTIDFLKAKKTKDGKLNKLGEWILGGGKTGWEIADKNMKYVLK